MEMISLSCQDQKNRSKRMPFLERMTLRMSEKISSLMAPVKDKHRMIQSKEARKA